MQGPLGYLFIAGPDQIVNPIVLLPLFMLLFFICVLLPVCGGILALKLYHKYLKKHVEG